MPISKRTICTALVVSTTTVFLLYNNAVSSSRNEDLSSAQFTQSDRLSCRWLGLCGVSHIEQGNLPKLATTVRGEALHHHLSDPLHEEAILPGWEAGPGAPSTAQNHMKPVPQFVLDHAPLVHLFSEEVYWPSDVAEHLRHITATVKYDFVQGELAHPTTANLAELNKADGDIGWKTYLQSNDNIEDMPAWLTSEYGIPVFDDEEAPTGQGTKKNYTVGGRSSAPAVLMVIDKGNGVIDAMWHFFYSYNLGNGVFGIRFGNHVGDWEHTVVRFHNGTPVEMFLSEHAGGSSYTYDAIEKDATGLRPVIYSAVGTHAMYAKEGLHPYIIPFGILKDETDKGPLWDPAKNMYAYHYKLDISPSGKKHDVGVRWGPKDRSKFSTKTDTLIPTTNTPDAPVSWFHFSGHWGDRYYPLSDPRQYRFFSEWAHVSGPPGPKFKAPGRPNICFNENSCTVLTSIEPLHWFLRVCKDWLIFLIVAWVVVMIGWGVITAFVRGWRCCSGVSRKFRGAGERESLLTGRTMEEPVSYGGVTTSRVVSRT